MKHDEEWLQDFAEHLVRYSVGPDGMQYKHADVMCKACREYAEIVNADLIERLNEIADIVDDAPELNMGNYTDDQASMVNDAINQIYGVVGEGQEFVE